MNLSQKVYIPAAIAVAAGIALWIITGDKTALIVSLTGLATGGIGHFAPPAPNVKQEEVVAISKRRQAPKPNRLRDDRGAVSLTGIGLFLCIVGVAILALYSAWGGLLVVIIGAGLCVLDQN